MAQSAYAHVYICSMGTSINVHYCKRYQPPLSLSSLLTFAAVFNLSIDRPTKIPRYSLELPLSCRLPSYFRPILFRLFFADLCHFSISRLRSLRLINSTCLSILYFKHYFATRSPLRVLHDVFLRARYLGIIPDFTSFCQGLPQPFFCTAILPW